MCLIEKVIFMLIQEIYRPASVTIQVNKTVSQALSLCLEKKVNALIVVNTAGKVVGVISVQDIAAATIPRQFRQNLGMAAAMYTRGFFHEMCREIAQKPVTAIMRRQFESVNLKDNIMSVTAEFLKNDLYIVPVIEKGELIGIVTRSQIKKAIAHGMGLVDKS